jgi:translation initiation factor eIF-2B subunit alpha
MINDNIYLDNPVVLKFQAISNPMMTNDTTLTSLSEQQNMENNSPLHYFTKLRQQEPEASAAITAIRTLLDVINRSSASTLVELVHELKSTVLLLTTQTDSSMPSVKSGCDLFSRFITLAKLDAYGIDECRQKLIERGEIFLERTLSSRQRISDYGQQFIVDGSIILTHSYSRVVLALLKYASNFTRFQVFVTQSEPDKSGLKMRDELEAIGIPAISILDASVAYVMEKVTFVLIGAEAVVESGGIINKIGTFNLAIAAHEMNKPFYVAAESFKFVRFYPLNNRDLPDYFKYRSSTIARLGEKKSC